MYDHVLPDTYATLPNGGAAGTTHDEQDTAAPENAPVVTLQLRFCGAPKKVGLHVQAHVPGDASAKLELATAAGAQGVGRYAPATEKEPRGVGLDVPEDAPGGQ